MTPSASPTPSRWTANPLFIFWELLVLIAGLVTDEARTNGVIPAIEGIRIIKERRS